MASLTVDVEAIRVVTGHLRTVAGELAPDAELLVVPEGAFESPVASALETCNADLLRQSHAVAEYVTSLADAGDRAADKILEVDAALAPMPAPGSGPQGAR